MRLPSVRRIENAPSPRRHLHAGGYSWVVREIPAPSFDRRGGMHLMFENEQIVRRVRIFPSEWIDLSDEELYALSVDIRPEEAGSG